MDGQSETVNSTILDLLKSYVLEVDEKNPYGLYRTVPLAHVDNYFRKPVRSEDRKEEVLEIKSGS